MEAKWDSALTMSDSARMQTESGMTWSHLNRNQLILSNFQAGIMQYGLKNDHTGWCQPVRVSSSRSANSNPDQPIPVQIDQSWLPPIQVHPRIDQSGKAWQLSTIGETENMMLWPEPNSFYTDVSLKKKQPWKRKIQKKINAKKLGK